MARRHGQPGTAQAPSRIGIGSIVLRVIDLAREKAFWMAALDIFAGPEGNRFCVAGSSG